MKCKLLVLIGWAHKSLIMVLLLRVQLKLPFRFFFCGNFFFLVVWSIAGVANPRPAGRMWPRKEFLRPNHWLELRDFSIFWVFFHSFYQKLAQIVNIFRKFSKCGPGTDLGWPPLIYRVVNFRMIYIFEGNSMYQTHYDICIV